MQDIRLLATEVTALREEMEEVKIMIERRSFLPPFYKRAIWATLIIWVLTLAFAVYRSVDTHRIYTILSDWSEYETAE